MILEPVKKCLRKIKDIIQFSKYYNKYKNYTMMPKEQYIDTLSLVAGFNNVEGCIVECGVWRGGMIAGFANVLGSQKKYYLFDSFEGLPPAKEIDGQDAIDWQKDIKGPWYFDNCKAEMDWAEKAMALSGAKNVNIVKGWFNDTLPGYKFDEPIAVLRLDADWYDSMYVCIENLFPLVSKGGAIIIDDYYVWDGCSKAIHNYLAKNERTERIMQPYSSKICYLIKK